MKNYTEEITEEMIALNKIEQMQIMSESDLKPRMIIKYNNEEELIVIDGEEEIVLFIEKLKQK